MGAQNAQRLNLYIDRFESCLESNDHSKELYNELMEDPEQADKANEVLESIIPPYYYGSHYSTPLGCVLYYLLREEPYTSLNVRLQDGHFDVPDRLFHSVFVTGRSCYENLPEVKELTPEWFFSTDFLVNRNHHRFGALQGGAEVDDVALPATLLAPATPQAFLSRHMQALEGPVVSTLLSQWIDLIFGFKQQGEQAVNSYNLFYYLTYPDQVDLSSAPDLETRNRLITQAAHFGQCPALAFTAPHPRRQLRLRAARDLRSVLLETNRMSIYLKHSMEGMGDRCRICRVSDVDPGALSILPSSVQRVLGNAECADNADRYFDARSPDCARSVEGAGSLPLILCPEPCLTWPADCHYPWVVEIDCNEFCVVTSFKVVLADRYDGAPPSSACYGVEFLAEDGRWTAVPKRTPSPGGSPLAEEVSQRAERGIVTTVVFARTTARFFRLSIFDVPFSPFPLRDRVVVQPDYTCGREELDAPSIPRSQRIPLPGPRITHIDVFGMPLFPLVPPFPAELARADTPVRALAVWCGLPGAVTCRDGLAAVLLAAVTPTPSMELRLFSRTAEPPRVVPLDVLAQNYCPGFPGFPVLAMHPAVRLPAVLLRSARSCWPPTGPRGVSSSSPSTKRPPRGSGGFRASRRARCARRRWTVRCLPRFLRLVWREFRCSDGELAVWSLDETPRQLCSVCVPPGVSLGGLAVCAELDCVVAFPAGEARGALLIYTTRLELRGEASVGAVLRVEVTNFGVVAVCAEEDACVLRKFDFCGAPTGVLRVEEVV